MQHGIMLQILLDDDGKYCSEGNSHRAGDLSGYRDCAVCPQCIIIKCSDIYGHMQRCNWNCAEHKFDLKNFSCISALRHGRVVSLARRDKDKNSPSCSVASLFKLNSTAVGCFEMTGVVRRSLFFCTSTWQVGMEEVIKQIKTPLSHLYTYLVIIVPRHLLLGRTKPLIWPTLGYITQRLKAAPEIQLINQRAVKNEIPCPLKSPGRPFLLFLSCREGIT